MHKIRPVIPLRFSRLCLAVGTLSGLAALGLSGQTAWADATCTPPANGPTGPDSSTFAYQCAGTYAGDWTNSYYVYNPSTGTQTALYSPDYSYDCNTNTWTQAEWDYDTNSSSYVENRVPATTTPDQSTNCATTTGSNNTSSTANSGNAANTAPNSSSPSSDTPGDPTAATAPPDPSATCVAPSAGPDTQTPGNANNGVTLNNGICSTSQSGNANVTDNGNAGDATSGNATTEVNVANLVNSLSSTSSAGVLTFNRDVTGDQNGDIILDPTAIGAGAGSPDANPGSTSGTVSTDMAINNAITATSVSGDATVSGNGKGGNATTGDAETIVNLINMINSAVAAGQSFIGTINIYGDLNGNILIPQSVIDQLLASNAYADPSASAESFNSNESITNNVNASANSGNASVTDNDVGGDATTGNAKTNVTILNLTGSSIVGKNMLLVFVNVLGQWVGMIMNAPTGATSAEFGGGITSNAPGTGNSVVEADTNLSITNNVNASANSGNATVSDNWVGGNATSGNASTAVNILNVEDSTLSLANWFGILFINVFGTWNGNFGIQPTAAPAVGDTGTTGDSSAVQTSASGPSYTGHPHHFATFTGTSDPSTTTTAGDTTAVLGDAIAAPLSHQIDTATQQASNDSHANYVLPILGLCFALLLLAGAERDRFLRHKGE